MCLYSTYMPNPKYKANTKNNGIPPQYKDARTLVVPIACGRCMECKKARAREWQIRLGEDVKYNTNGVFVTLTFNEETLRKLGKEIPKEIQGYARDNAIATLAVKKFCNRWRKRTGKNPRHWLITELGHKGTERIHLHGIIWTDERKWIDKHWNTENKQGSKFGFTWIQKKNKTVGQAITNYITKYLTKDDKLHREYKSIILCSRGIGKDFLENDKLGYYKFKEEETKEQYVAENWGKRAMPMYYRRKLWTDEEREKLWIHKLNKEERYVLGTKISIKEGIEHYYKVLMNARSINERLGYGNDEKNWNRIAHENTIRNILHKKHKKNLEVKENNNTFDISKYNTNYEQLKNVF